MKCPNCGKELLQEYEPVMYKCPECLMTWTGQQLLSVEYISLCCDATYIVETGISDFLGDTEEEADKYPRTVCCKCSKCGEYCNLKLKGE